MAAGLNGSIVYTMVKLLHCLIVLLTPAPLPDNQPYSNLTIEPFDDAAIRPGNHSTKKCRMQVEADQLPDLHYRPFAELEHARLVQFTQENIRPGSPVSTGYWLLNAAIAGFIGLQLVRQDSVPLPGVLARLGLGFFVFFAVLLPLHELIHGLAYKLVGAKAVSYHADWRKFTFYAAADGFVVSTREFYGVALAPFAIINAGLLLGYALAGPAVAWVCLGALLLHMGGCAGDFALVNFLYKHRRKALVTYDDMGAAKSFFYARG